MELRFDEGRIYGARYYSAEPIFKAHVSTWFVEEWKELEDWCLQSFGPLPKDGVFSPGGRWYINNSRFYFREKKDMEWFILRWQ